MATPQLENGYTQIANEILESLSRINLSPYETRTLFYLIRKTYGWKKKTDWISLSQFSKGLCLDRRHVFKALRRLEVKNLIVICRNDKKHPRYGFQKNYMKWDISDFNKAELEQENLKRRKKKESASTDDRVSSLQTPTKETITKETLRKKKEENSSPFPFLFLKEVKANPDRTEEWLKRKEVLLMQAEQLSNK